MLVAVPVHQAGSASGLFSTAQQLGGAVGVAVISSVFFAWLPGHGFASAFARSAPYAVVGYLVCAGLCFLLPTTAVEGVPGAEIEEERGPRQLTGGGAQRSPRSSPAARPLAATTMAILREASSIISSPSMTAPRRRRPPR